MLSLGRLTQIGLLAAAMILSLLTFFYGCGTVNEQDMSATSTSTLSSVTTTTSSTTTTLQKRWMGMETLQSITGTGTDNASNAIVAMNSTGQAITAWLQGETENESTLTLWARQYDGVNWTAPQAVIFPATTKMAAAIDSNGHAILVYFRFNDSGQSYHYSLHARRFNGSIWGEEKLLIDRTAGDPAFAPQIAIDANGNALLVWVDGDEFQDNIYSCGYVAASGDWTSPETVNTDNLSCSSPQIAMDHNGSAIVAWRQTDGADDYYSYARVFTGTGWGSVAEISAGKVVGTDYPFGPKVTMGGNGRGAVLWARPESEFQEQLYVVTYDGTWSSAEQISNASMETISNPKLAMDGDGNMIAVWHQGSEGTFNSHIYARRFNGTSWGPTIPLDSYTGYSSGISPDIRFDKAGNAVAAWASTAVYARYYDRSLGQWGAKRQINNGMGELTNPEIAVDGDGNAIAVWTQANNDFLRLARYNIYR